MNIEAASLVNNGNYELTFIFLISHQQIYILKNKKTNYILLKIAKVCGIICQ